MSLANHLEAVTNLVIEWRRLELRSWHRLLDDARDSAGNNPARWWFYIYQLVEDCLEKTKKGSYCGKKNYKRMLLYLTVVLSPFSKKQISAFDLSVTATPRSYCFNSSSFTSLP